MKATSSAPELSEAMESPEREIARVREDLEPRPIRTKSDEWSTREDEPTMKKTIIAITVLMGSVGCANAHRSQRQLAETQAVIDAAAHEAGSTNPAVALHLEYAKDQVARAKELMRRHKQDAAQRMLDRAQADADLAIAIADSARSRQQAQEAWDEVEQLRQRAQQSDVSGRVAGEQTQQEQQMKKGQAPE